MDVCLEMEALAFTLFLVKIPYQVYVKSINFHMTSKDTQFMPILLDVDASAERDALLWAETQFEDKKMNRNDVLNVFEKLQKAKKEFKTQFLTDYSKKSIGDLTAEEFETYSLYGKSVEIKVFDEFWIKTGFEQR